MRNSGPARFFIPLGIILVVFGIILLGIKTDNFVETTGKIISVVECPRTDVEEAVQYDVKVTYTADGKEYTTTWNNMSGNYKTGETVKVYYNPEDPESTTNNKSNGLIGVILIVVGAAALVFGVFKTAKAFKNSKELDSTSGGSASNEEFERFKNSAEVTEYYFRFDGHSLRPGYIVEDANRNVLFEGKMLKNALVGARKFEFNDHTTGKVKEHDVGHTITQSYNDEFFSAKSWFKFDGKNVWDVIHERGVRISTSMFSKFPNVAYNASKNGTPFMRIETCSVYVHEEDEAQHSFALPTGHMYYRFWTSSNDFETLFLTIFAISETEQAVVE